MPEMIENEERLMTPEVTQHERDEKAIEIAIRPKELNDYIGQRAVCEQLDIFIRAAQSRGEALDHTLLFGPPGLGKNNVGQHYRDRNARQP